MTTSDHLPLFLNLMKQVYVPRAKRFKFENTWIREQDCRGVVKQGWERAGCGTILEKIRSCGSKLQEWGGSKIVDTSSRCRIVIETYFVEFFSSSNTQAQLSEREGVNRVTESDNEEFLAEIHEDEVKEAVFAMHPDKACGPDGLNPAFFQVFWDIVKNDVIIFCRRFMQYGELPIEANETVVCLIPKVKEPKVMGDLRPISLCNVLIRILTKVLTNRLKKVLGAIISDRKSAFVGGRLLTDNALIAFEINHYMERKTQGKEGVAGLKIDISKAYDRLEWSFIRSMLQKFGFSNLWVERVMQVITSVSYKFLHNGEEFGHVIPQRGVRQGDPMSPYIYI